MCHQLAYYLVCLKVHQVPKGNVFHCWNISYLVLSKIFEDERRVCCNSVKQLVKVVNNTPNNKYFIDFISWLSHNEVYIV